MLARGNGGVGSGSAAPVSPKNFAKVDLLSIENNSEKKVTKIEMYKSFQIPRIYGINSHMN